MSDRSSRRPLDAALLERLEAICGAPHLVRDLQVRSVYGSDALTRRRSIPGVAVLPGTAGEVAAVVRACGRAGVAWVPRGAGTGLAAGVLTPPDAVLIVLTRLRAIRSVEPVDGRVRVEPGVTLAELARVLGPGHRIALDPYTASVATVGGLIATGGGGPRSLRHGAAVDHVLGLDLVLSDGRELSVSREDGGIDLLAAFCGSEGTLGVIVGAELAVSAVPASVQTVLAHFSSAVEAARAAAAIVGDALDPSALELLDARAIRAAGRAHDAGYRPDAGAALLVEFEGAPEATLVGLERAIALAGRSGARDVRIALDGRERAELWRVPAVVYVAARRLAPGLEILDLAVPPSRLGTVLAQIEVLAEAAGLAVAILAHAGEGIVHPILLFDSSGPEASAAAAGLAADLIGLAVRAGGSVAAEHGTGADGTAALARMLGAAELGAGARLRDALEPSGLANPLARTAG